MKTKAAPFTFVAALALAGCGAQTPLSPDTSSVMDPSTIVLTSASDARLPLPGEEAAGVPDEAYARNAGVGREVERRPSAVDPASFWNGITTTYGIAAKQPPPMIARSYALTHVAIFDALAAGGDARRGRLPQSAVAAGAASAVLGYLFPASAADIDSIARGQADLTGGGRDALRAWLLGRAVGELVVEHGRHDRSDAVYHGTPPTGPGIWTGVNPVLPMCGTWKCWFIRAGDQIQPEPPYPFGSEADLRDLDEVYQISLARTPEQVAIVHKWADQPPPTIWNSLLLPRVAGGHMSPLRSARAFAFLNMGMYDAFVSCWSTKYTYWIARPFQRQPGLTTVITTPNFPSYTSGHSTISAAAAVIMGRLFPGERDFFAAQAEEAAMSRLWGGIHFRHDNDQGLVVGRRIGMVAARRMGNLEEADLTSRR